MGTDAVLFSLRPNVTCFSERMVCGAYPLPEIKGACPQSTEKTERGPTKIGVSYQIFP
jgi:hypothetical protein